MLNEEKKLREKKEILFYYESRQNPNGDPGFENQPRVMPDDTLMVTDVRIKRTMRDYAKRVLEETLFVDFGEDGNPVKADERAKEIINRGVKKKLKKLKEEDLNNIDVIASLLKRTFDVPLFGALVTIRSKTAGGGNSQKLTGPLQFGMARSINQVEVINPQISSRFVGHVKETKEKKVSMKQFSTFGRFYSVKYALIKVHGALNPQNLEKYLDDKEIKKKFDDCCKRIFECLWNGTNELVTRSKFPQRSILYLEITYKDTIYNDLPSLVNESEDLKKGKVSELGKSPFDFEKFLSAIEQRKSKIKEIRIKGSEDISSDIKNIIEKSKPIPIKEIVI
jgi:CRISPR-associated protein Csh2